MLPSSMFLLIDPLAERGEDGVFFLLWPRDIELCEPREESVGFGDLVLFDLTVCDGDGALSLSAADKESNPRGVCDEVEVERPTPGETREAEASARNA